MSNFRYGFLGVILFAAGIVRAQSLVSIRAGVDELSAVSAENAPAQIAVLKSIYRNAVAVAGQESGGSQRMESSAAVAASLEPIKTRLIALCENDNMALRSAAVYVLQYAAPANDTKAALYKIAVGPVDGVGSSAVRTAIFALFRFGGDTGELKQSFLKRLEDTFVRRDPEFGNWASDASYLGIVEAVPTLVNALGTPGADIQHLATALKRFGEPAVDALPTLRQALARAKGEKADFRVIEALEFAIAAIDRKGVEPSAQVSSGTGASGDSPTAVPVSVTQKTKESTLVPNSSSTDGVDLPWAWISVILAAIVSTALVLRKKMKS